MWDNIRVGDILKKLRGMISEFMSQDSNLFVYSLSFGLLLSLAPSLIVFAMMFKYGAFVDTRVVLELLHELHLSIDIQMMMEEIFIEFIQKDYGLIPAITTLILSFWLASRSINSFLLISANHEKVDVVKFSIRIQSIFMFLVFVVLLIGGVIFAAFVYNVLDPSLLPFVATIFMVPLFTLMYRALSFRKRPLNYGLLGGIFTTSAILLLSYFSFFLINRMITYDQIYGSLATLVALLLVIYIISCIIYFGFLMNLIFEDSYGKEETLPLKHAKYYEICRKIYAILPFVNKH